jgi:rhamnose utilization protein RhaD (predicted bifunctional aldolase and dehydrogenase)
MALTVPPMFENHWNPPAGLSEIDALVYRSNLLASDRAIVNFGGGNTSVKTREADHTGREASVLWVKGSGSDLATITAAGFAGLRLDEVVPLARRDSMTDAEMVAYLARCQLDPAMPRPSIETLLHAFVPHAHVDHTHPDSIGAIVGTVEGERLAAECFGSDAIWIPYLRPGFALSKLVADAVAESPEAKLVLLAKHGLVTWGETAEESYAATLDAINRAAAFIAERAHRSEAFGGRAVEPLGEVERTDVLAAVLPALRGAVSADGPRILQPDTSAAVLEFISGAEAPQLSQVGAACPDHLVHTRRRPVWVAFDAGTDDAEALRERIVQRIGEWQEQEIEFFERYRTDERLGDPSPRVILIQGVGLVSVGRTLKAARIARDLYHRAISVMRAASALGGFVSLDDAESFAIEYWPLELYKLSLAPPPGEFQGMIALITGARGIGSAARALAAGGACVVATDLDARGPLPWQRSSERSRSPHAPTCSTRPPRSAPSARRCSPSAASTWSCRTPALRQRPLEETTLELWDRNNDILARGYFLVAREARAPASPGHGRQHHLHRIEERARPRQERRGYSAAKAASLHLARSPGGARVVAHPGQHRESDAVLEGSRILAWASQRGARAYGIAADDLPAHYRERTTLKVNVVPADIAEAVLYFASPRRATKSTGNILNVDGGVALAYPR